MLRFDDTSTRVAEVKCRSDNRQGPYLPTSLSLCLTTGLYFEAFMVLPSTMVDFNFFILNTTCSVVYWIVSYCIAD